MKLTPAISTCFAALAALSLATIAGPAHAATLPIDRQITGVVHSFVPPGTLWPGSPGYVQDEILFDATGLTNVNLSQFASFKLRLFAAAGEKVVVNRAGTYASGLNVFYAADGDSSSHGESATLTFESFGGLMPTRDYSLFYVGDSGNVLLFQAQESYSGGVEFTALSYSFTAAYNPANTAKNFVQGSSSSIPVVFAYATTASIDPGPFVSLVPVSPVQPACILFQHTGSTVPASEGWQLTGSGATAGPIDDAGTPAWFTTDTSNTVGLNVYFANVSNAQAASAASLGWTLTTRVRVTAVSTFRGSPYVGFSDGTHLFEMLFAGKTNGDAEVSLYNNGAPETWPTYTVVNGMNAYHVFSLVYDPVAGSADLFVDGVERLSDYTGAANSQQYVDWGTGSSGFTGSANFNLVKFSITRPLPAWRQLQGLSSNGSQDLASPSGDGIANLLKYAFNMAPNAGDLATPNSGVLPANGTAGLPRIGRDAQGRLVIEFVRRHADTKPGVTYTVETGDDLANLQPLSLSGATVVPVGALWERVTVTDPVVTGKRFGRVRVQASETYTNDFNAGLGTASLRRDAVWINQAVRLTDDINGQFGAVVLDGLEPWPAVRGFTAKFNATFGPTSNAPADGLSFSVGNLGTDAWAEAGPPTSHHLSIGFDTFENEVGILEATGIHLWVSGTHVAYNPINPYTNGVAVPVEVSYDTTTGVTVTFDGIVIFNNVAVPSFNFQTGDRFGFGGRTGGFNERKVIDDVEITTR